MNRTKIDWCDVSVNPLRLKCQHICKYCYMFNRFYKFNYYYSSLADKRALNLDCLSTKIKEKTIFIGSGTDIFGNWVPTEIINQILEKCNKIDKSNTLVFLTKNPIRYQEFNFQKNVVLGATIESDKDLTNISKACPVSERINAMTALKQMISNKTLISIEPVIEFSNEF